MVVTYSDPWKDNPFGRLKGTKNDTWFKVVFDEAKFHLHDDVLYLTGFFSLMAGVQRVFGDGAINPGLVELPIYGKEYEIRQKKAGTGTNGTKSEYESVKCQPSTVEKLLYQHIVDNPSTYMPEGKAIKGEITFNPDANYEHISDDDKKLEAILPLVKIETIEPSGKHPDWKPPKPFRKGGYGGNSSVSPNEKLEFLKKELFETIGSAQYEPSKGMPLAAYIHQVITDNQENERFLVIYFDLLKAMVS